MYQNGWFVRYLFLSYFFVDFFFSGITLSINKIPSRWSISCWMMTALKSLYFCFCLFPVTSVNSILICLCLLTMPVSPGSEIHASSQRIVSLDLSMIVGLIMIVVQRSLFFLGLSSRWLVAMILMFCPICGAAKPTPSCFRIIIINVLQNASNSSSISSIWSETLLRMGLFIPVWIFLMGYLIY